jgi:hypothetical protein
MHGETRARDTNRRPSQPSTPKKRAPAVTPGLTVPLPRIGTRNYMSRQLSVTIGMTLPTHWLMASSL